MSQAEPAKALDKVREYYPDVRAVRREGKFFIEASQYLHESGQLVTLARPEILGSNPGYIPAVNQALTRCERIEELRNASNPGREVRAAD